jgi:DNA-binding beta-propeller fold protein YncE
VAHRRYDPGVSRLRALTVAVLAALVCALIPASAGAAFSLIGSWGGVGEGDGLFAGQIGGVATAANGDVYVVDKGSTPGKSLIEEFGATGTFIREWGTQGSGAGEMWEPGSIAIAGGGSDAGDIYVVDGRNRRVDEFAPEGTFIRAWGWAVIKETPTKHEFQICTTGTGCQEGEPNGEGKGGFEIPSGVAVDQTSGDVYISDALNPGSFAIQKFGPNGEPLGPVGAPADNLGELTGLATDPSGDLYIVDASNERIQELSPSGAFIRMWGNGVHEEELGPVLHFGICTSKCKQGEPGESAGDFNFIGNGVHSSGAPGNIAVDASGNIWVPDGGDLRVQEFTSTGEFVMGFGWGVQDGMERQFETCTDATTCRAGVEGPPGQFEKPVGAAAAPSGCPIYVTDANANELVDEFGTCGGGGEPEPPPAKPNEPEPKPNQPPNTSTGGSTSSTGGSSNGTNNQPLSAAQLEEHLATAFGLPSAKLCYSKRSFKIHIQQPPGYPKVVSAEVFLGHKRERSLNKKGLTDQVVLTQLPYGTFTIRIVARTATGTTLKGTRTYHTCRSKPIHPHGHPHL